MIKRVKYYTLLKKVGEGGMGTVYKAEDDRNGRIVAIKELDPQKAQIEDYRARFSREERILSRLNHPNIVSPIEAFAEDGTLYIAMEFIDGQSLDYKIRKISGPITFISARVLMIKMLEGFSHAHQAGVIHRDIKPANILISDSGDLKITDFGIAKITTGEERTTANIKLGTLCYMSPEQLTTADVDERSDIYSLGMSFYEMLAGQLPFTKDQRENPGALTLRISNSEPFPLPSNFYPHIPKRVENIVLRMLEKDITKRYSSMKEVLNELQQFDLSDPERTLMEEYEKIVKFDPTILTQGRGSDSDVPSSPREKPSKEMTWEGRQERARILETEFREKKRLAEEEERLRKDEIERARIEKERKIAEIATIRKKKEFRIGVGIICAYLLVIGFILISMYIEEKLVAEEKAAHEKQFTENMLRIIADPSTNTVFVEGKTFTEGSKSWSKFAISKFEVTQELWESVMGNNPSVFKGSIRPVQCVSWYDAVEFCNKLSESEGLTPAYKIDKSRKDSNDTDVNDELKWWVTCDFNASGYRLPTAAEWEYAARGGDKSKGYKYSGSNYIYEVAWVNGNSDRESHVVGQMKSNELGIYDMTGNVDEWCWDKVGGSSSRVLAGNCYYHLAEVCDLDARDGYSPDFRGDSIGFRVVRTK